jgi:class 3 adenylate cyclase
MAQIHELVEHLKQNPMSSNVAELSRQFGVSEQLVRTVIHRLQAPTATPAKPQQTASPVGQRLKSFWLKITANPWLFAPAIVALTGLIPFGLRALNATGALHPLAATILGNLAFAAFLLGAPILLICLAVRHRRLLVLAYGAAAFMVGFLTFAVIGSVNTRSASLPQLIGGSLALVLIIIVAGAPIVQVAAYLDVRRARRDIEKLTRQQMLDRLLRVRAILADPDSFQQTTAFDKPWVRTLERSKYAIALISGLAVSVVQSMIMSRLDPDRVIIQGAQESAAVGGGAGILVAMAFVVISSALQFLVAYLARRIGEVVLVTVLYQVPALLLVYLPFSYTRLSDVAAIGVGRYSVGILMLVAVAAVGALARYLTEHAIQVQRRNANDPEVLVPEMLELERRLSVAPSEVAVMVVDVAGSTAMKVGADPLVAEWTFREYQEFVAQLCAPFGGTVHATAGDGTILGFASPVQARLAATALLQRLDEFNASQNRLDHPFTVRIGLHYGLAQGELRDIQFTRVIDVAAHIEAKAPLMGVAASAPFVAADPEGSWRQLALNVDSFDVFMLDNPGN